jgi:hypothetical protein
MSALSSPENLSNHSFEFSSNFNGCASILFFEITIVAMCDVSKRCGQEKLIVDGMKECKLLSGQFAILVQFILAFICFLTLAIKWHFERPKRSPTVWVLDGTKQGIGSITGHMANIFLSTIIAHNRYHHHTGNSLDDDNDGSSSSSGNGDGDDIDDDDDECKWYLLNYLSDSTFGIIFNILILKLLSSFIHSFSSPSSSPSSPSSSSYYPPAHTSHHSPHHSHHHRHHPHRSLIWFQFGYYGNPISLSIWFIQLLLWLLIVLCGKFLTFLIFYLISNEINDLISPFFLIFKGYPKVELIVVMIIIPFLLNSIQFWIQDSYLMIDPSEKSRDEDQEDEKVESQLLPPSLMLVITV